MVTTLMQAYEIISTQSVTRHPQPSNRVVLVLPEIRGTIDSFRFNHISKFIESGRKVAEACIEEIKERVTLNG